MKDNTLPKTVPGDSYRFRCTYIRRNPFNGCLVLDIDGDTFELPGYAVKIGKNEEGFLCCDVKERTAKEVGLI